MAPVWPIKAVFKHKHCKLVVDTQCPYAITPTRSIKNTGERRRSRNNPKRRGEIGFLKVLGIGAQRRHYRIFKLETFKMKHY